MVRACNITCQSHASASCTAAMRSCTQQGTRSLQTNSQHSPRVGVHQRLCSSKVLGAIRSYLLRHDWINIAVYIQLCRRGEKPASVLVARISMSSRFVWLAGPDHFVLWVRMRRRSFHKGKVTLQRVHRVTERTDLLLLQCTAMHFYMFSAVLTPK
jgi:hypothetical protein